MHLSHRLMLSLFCAVAAVSMAFAFYQVQAETHALNEPEVQRQAIVLAESQSGPVERLFSGGSAVELQTLVDHFLNHQHPAGMAVYDGAAGANLAITSGLAPSVHSTPAAVADTIRTGREHGQSLHAGERHLRIFAAPLSQNGQTSGAIAVIYTVTSTGVAGVAARANGGWCRRCSSSPSRCSSCIGASASRSGT